MTYFLSSFMLTNQELTCRLFSFLISCSLRLQRVNLIADGLYRLIIYKTSQTLI